MDYMDPLVIVHHPEPCDPYVIFQTYKERVQVPTKVNEAWERYAPEYKRIVFQDEEMRSFLRYFYAPVVLERFDSLRWPHKADLWRYCVLYTYGGLYADIKTELVRPVREIIRDPSDMLVIEGAFSENEGFYNGFIYSPVKESPFFLKLIRHVVGTTNEEVKDYYHTFCKYLDETLNKEYCISGCQRGWNKTIDGFPNVVIYKETDVDPKDYKECNGSKDRYNLCVVMLVDGQVQFKTRYHDYPW